MNVLMTALPRLAGAARLLEEHNFVYDSSLMSHDFLPFRPRIGDQVHADGTWDRGTPSGTMCELPVSWLLDDFPAREFILPPPISNTGLQSASRIVERWQGQFRYCHERVGLGSVFTLTTHPQTVGRGDLLLQYEDFLSDVAAQPNVTFDTAIDVATRWLSRERRIKACKAAIPSDSRITTLCYGDLQEAASLFASVFTKQETMTKTLGISEEAMLPWCADLTALAIESGLSLGVRDPEHGLVACLLCYDRHDFVQRDSQGAVRPFPLIDPIMHMLNSLEEQGLAHSRMPPVARGSHLHHFVAATHDAFQKSQLATTMCKVSEAAARASGYKVIFCEPTGPASQHIKLHKLGYERIAEVPYSAFTAPDGCKSFSAVTEVPTCVLAAKFLDCPS
jgi:hypothetical protein